MVLEQILQVPHISIPDPNQGATLKVNMKIMQSPEMNRHST